MSNETPRRVPVYFPRRHFLRSAAMLAGSAAAGLSMPIGSLIAAESIGDSSGALVSEIASQEDLTTGISAQVVATDSADGDAGSPS